MMLWVEKIPAFIYFFVFNVQKNITGSAIVNVNGTILQATVEKFG